MTTIKAGDEVRKIRDHLRHMTDGRWHDSCHWCLTRRVKGGDGLTDDERALARQAAADEREQYQRAVAERQEQLAADLGTHADLPDPVHGHDVFSRIEASTE